MGVEVKDTEGTLARSVMYMERCSHRFDPAYHVCAGILCINGANMAETCHQAQVPLMVVVTNAFLEGMNELREKICAQHCFRGLKVLLVNSRSQLSTRGQTIEDHFGLPELAQELEHSVAEGRRQAKPRALDEIRKRQDLVLSATARLRTETSNHATTIAKSATQRADSSLSPATVHTDPSNIFCTAPTPQAPVPTFLPGPRPG
jgi:hypothetical protein